MSGHSLFRKYSWPFLTSFPSKVNPKLLLTYIRWVLYKKKARDVKLWVDQFELNFSTGTCGYYKVIGRVYPRELNTVPGTRYRINKLHELSFSELLPGFATLGLRQALLLRIWITCLKSPKSPFSGLTGQNKFMQRNQLQNQNFFITWFCHCLVRNILPSRFILSWAIERSPQIESSNLMLYVRSRYCAEVGWSRGGALTCLGRSAGLGTDQNGNIGLQSAVPLDYVNYA